MVGAIAALGWTGPGAAGAFGAGWGRDFSGGTGGGYGPVGVNGSKVFLPFGLDPKTTPVMGSYKENTLAAKATSAWYELPPRSADRPIVAVPTSVGYGASYRGLAALLAMLNACAPGIGVVNIDNGFGAGYLAAVIARRFHRP